MTIDKPTVYDNSAEDVFDSGLAKELLRNYIADDNTYDGDPLSWGMSVFISKANRRDAQERARKQARAALNIGGTND